MNTTGSAVLKRTGDADWSGPLDATSTLNFTGIWSIPQLNFSETTDGSASGKVASSSDLTILDMDDSRGFTLEFEPYKIATKYKTVTKDAGGTKELSSVVDRAWTPVWATPIPYPESGTALSGVVLRKTSLVVKSFPDLVDIEYRLTYSLVPDTPETLTLEIDNSKAYQAWRPGATTDGGPGDSLTVTANVVSSTGKPPLTPVGRFSWELIKTSKEKGVALNFPVNASDTRFDMDLDAQGKSFTLSDDKQRLEREVVEGFSDSIQVLPFDWGGWSELKVTAVLIDGRRLVGKLKGAGEENARLPKRAANSFIADQWKADHKVSGADRSDDESDPVGDGTPGDGLTLYEEYRGFYQAGQHIEGDPKKKDFFIRNVPEGATLRGIGRFQAISRLAVHSEFTEDEFPQSRIMNANRDQGPNVTDQHGVIIEVVEKQTGFAQADGGPANPNKITKVKLMEDWATLGDGYLATIVAHELLHCVNVWHHGDGDYEAYWRLNASDELVEVRSGGAYEGTPIRVLTEAGLDVTERWKAITRLQENGRIKLNVGVDQGEHSGHGFCIARYNNSQAYVSRADKSIRYKVAENHGISLCNSPAGTGVNDSDHNPQSRYGAADPKRGDCLHQILVNDLVTAPSRK
ncbi:MAG: hypothetical protein NTY38_25735 [Acidobacteria bacterium]|nr:hypothetical protein [Acidobacteriota bacterium]